MLIQKQFTDSDIIQQTRSQYERESDSVKLFLDEENYKPSTIDTVEMKLLYPAYRNFCQDNGYKPVNNLNFRKRLESSNIVIDKKNTGNVAYLSKESQYSQVKWG